MVLDLQDLWKLILFLMQLTSSEKFMQFITDKIEEFNHLKHCIIFRNSLPFSILDTFFMVSLYFDFDRL